MDSGDKSEISHLIKKYHMTTNGSDLSDMYLRDLNFLPSAKSDVVRNMSTSCSSYNTDSLFSLERKDMEALDKVLEVVPSTCMSRYTYEISCNSRLTDTLTSDISVLNGIISQCRC